MVSHRPDERVEASVLVGQAPVDDLPPIDAPRLDSAPPPPPPPPPAGPPDLSASATWPSTRPRRRRRLTPWLVGAGTTCLVVIATVLGIRTWDLTGQVSDLTDKNGALTEENGSLDDTVSEVTAERDSLRANFPISYAAMADSDLAGTYEFLFVPVAGECTYSDCDQIGPTRYALTIDRTADGYALGLEDLPGALAPMSRQGDVYSSSGVLPESLWGACGDTPAETSFELHLTVAAVGLAGTDLRAVETSGTYSQYTPANLDCGPSESTSTFTARRTG